MKYGGMIGKDEVISSLHEFTALSEVNLASIGQKE
jgi:hypothetical protein